MSKKQLAKRVSAFSMAAALSVSAVAWDYSPLFAKKAGNISYAVENTGDEAETDSQSQIKKSEYPLFLDVVTTKTDEDTYLITVDKFDVISNFFDIMLVIPDSTKPDGVIKYRMSDEGIGISAGEYDVEITVKSGNNPYDVSGFSGGKKTVKVNTEECNASRYVSPEGVFYYTSDGSVVVPVDYDKISYQGRDGDNNIIIKTPDGETSFAEDGFTMDTGFAIAAELRQGNVPESENYTVERFTADSSLPYFYGEKLMIKPDCAKVTVNTSEGQKIFAEDTVITVGEDEIISSSKLTVSVWDDRDKSKPMEGFVVEEKPDRFIVKIDPVSGGAPNSSYTIYQADERHNWGRNMPHSETNGTIEIEKKSMKGDMNYVVVMKEITDHALDYSRDCGTAAFIESYSYVRVIPNKYYTVTDGSVYYIDDDEKNTRVELKIDTEKTGAANDGFIYFKIDKNKIHSKKTFKVDFKMELDINLLELIENNATKPLDSDIAECSVYGYFLNGSNSVTLSNGTNAFDMAAQQGAELKVTIKRPDNWVVKEVTYNNYHNGDKDKNGDQKLYYDEEHLKNPNKPFYFDVFFDKNSMTQDVKIIFGPREYVQEIETVGQGTAEITNISDGKLGFGDHAGILAAPAVGSYVSEIRRKSAGEADYTTIFKNGRSTSSASSLEVRDDGSVLFTDGEAITDSNDYQVVFSEAAANDYANTFAVNEPSTGTLFNSSEKSSGIDYSLSYLVTKYSLTYNRGTLFAGKNVKISAPAAQTYSFIDSDTVSCEREKELIDEVIDRPVYFLDMQTGVITCSPLRLHIATPDIVIDKDSVTNNSALRYLTFGIFGKDETTVTVKAEDKSAVPLTISDIVLWDLNENEAVRTGSAGEIEYSFDPKNDPVSKKDVSIKVSTEEGHIGEFIVKQDGSEWIIAPRNENEYNNVYLETVPPVIKISAVDAADSAGRDVISALDESKNGRSEGFYPDDNADAGRFNAYVDSNNAYWVNRAFRYDVSVSDPSGAMKAEAVADGSRTPGSSGYNGSDKDSAENAQYQEYVDMSGDGAHTVTVSAEDIPGNAAAAVKKTVSIDTKAPVLASLQAFVINPDGSKAVYNGQWTNKPVEIVVTARDDGSGVMQVVPDHWDGIIKNDQTLNLTKENPSGSKPHYEKVYTYRINPSANETYVFRAKDNVGNETEIGRYTVKTENIAPSIKGFTFDRSTLSPYSKGSEKDNVHAANGSVDGYSPVETDRYGYYFTDDTIVSVKADDLRGGSGLNSNISRIEYALIDSDSISNNNGQLSGELIDKAQKFTVSNINDPKFTVSAFWKGQVVVRAFDNAGNNSGWLTPDGMILESQAQHDSETHITVAMPAAKQSGNLYDSAITIPISIHDRAGIRSVSWSLTSESGKLIRQGGFTVENGAIVNSSGNNLQWTVHAGGKDRDNITDLNAQLSVSDQRNNMKLHISMTCNSDHNSTYDTSFSIDSTAPKIGEVVMNGTPVQKDGKTYYNTSRAATISVYERNLDQSSLSKAVEVAIADKTGTKPGAGTYTISNWIFDNSTKSDTDEEGANRWTATLTLNADAEYSNISFSVADTLGHKSTGSVKGGFIIDKTSPVISGGFDNNDAKNGNYYNASRKAIVKINEHNFIPKDAVVNIRAYGEDNITSVETVKIDAASWKQSQINPDEWSAEFDFNEDGRYIFSVDYADPANNRGKTFSSGEFYIDTKAPSISQTFTKNGSDKFATNGKYDPTVTFTDYNLPDETKVADMCTVEISKMDVKGNVTDMTRVTSKKYTAPSKGSAGEYETWHSIFGDVLETDGIYKIKITSEDMAGNTSKPLDLTVSVNRYGATYEVVNADAAVAVKKFKEGLPVNVNTDVVIREVNATEMSGESTVTIIRNGSETKTLTSRDFDIKQSRSAGGEGWYENVYTLKNENFKDDGDYLINIESADEAGNLNSNNTPVYADRKCAVEFSIDKTAPEVIISGVEEGAVLKDSEVQLRITCSDQNLKKLEELSDEELILTVNGDEYKLSDLGKISAEISNDDAGNIIMELPVKSGGKRSEEKIVVTVKDMAGNTSDKERSSIDFTLSASFWDLHKGLVIGLGSAGLLGLLAVLVLFIKKRRSF
ncbi:MAG TPA: hypothetical protein P5191_04410 [Ruminococcus sp.]|nr:hypothetical protein [Ruminococcus sp.]